MNKLMVFDIVAKLGMWDIVLRTRDGEELINCSWCSTADFLCHRVEEVSITHESVEKPVVIIYLEKSYAEIREEMCNDRKEW